MITNIVRPLTDSLRDVMAGVCTPVSVVTTLVEGRPHGTTVSAFSSLSMDPPMVMVALDRKSNTLSAIQESGRFALNILGTRDEGVARQFATKGDDKFASVEWCKSSGSARLRHAYGWVACTVRAVTDGGDHVIIAGEVLEAELVDAEPLTYHRRNFGTHAPLPSDTH
ncbi:flavin reductase family protein [Gordonia rhizosphera]|uniref:Putative oxidoreductase n=1 Tax=Gordonia rhizosphera NBRC 16068 TaxID=1108045 RepID=K6WIM2_9ACTN|nr:flavin reductase family protein [Gordonia rhizosphera]GAB92012.1 putative oxidoreductase [Gordonia rhizosphera NBRC 16068]